MKTKFILILVIIACSTLSCNKAIDLNSPTALPPARFYNTESDIKSAITGVYALLRTNYNSYYFMSELPSDNVDARAENVAFVGFWDNLGWTAFTTNFEDIWINYYNTIAQCNLILSKLDGVTFVKNSTKAQYAAELKFIRALMYFELVYYFGEVPIVLEPITSDQQVVSASRKPVVEVYAQIEKDLQEAEGGVPAAYTTASDLGRVTSGAVKSLLGKVFLYQKKYTNAEVKLAEVVNNTSYGLMPNPGDAFSITNEYNKEVIFTIQYSRVLAGVGEGSPFAVAFVPDQAGVTSVAGGGSNIGTIDLYRLFKAGDKRKDLIGVWKRGNVTDSVDLSFYYYTKKFTDNPPTATDGENNWILIRYADVVLLYAEALNEQGKTEQALDEVKRIRERAGASTLSTTLDKDKTREAIKLERRLELCYEGHRWPDLVRWGDYLTVMNAYKAKYKMTAMQINDYDKLFPIPNRERIINPALTQNSGY